VMNAGRIEQLGPPQELYDLPRTAFVGSHPISFIAFGHGARPASCR